MRALAAQFRHMNADVIRFARECSPDDWRRMVPHEGRSVAYLIDHFVFGYRIETKAIRAIVTGQEQPLAWDELPPTFTMEELHAMNATRWEADSYPDREETVERLRAEGERTAEAPAGYPAGTRRIVPRLRPICVNDHETWRPAVILGRSHRQRSAVAALRIVWLRFSSVLVVVYFTMFLRNSVTN